MDPSRLNNLLLHFDQLGTQERKLTDRFAIAELLGKEFLVQRDALVQRLTDLRARESAAPAGGRINLLEALLASVAARKPNATGIIAAARGLLEDIRKCRALERSKP